MPERSLLREIEKKAWLQTFEHGMWDIAIGSLFLMMGLTIATDLPSLAAIWVAAMLPALRQAGRKLVIPRLGHARFRGKHRRARANTSWILAVVAILGLGAFLFMFWSRGGNTPAWVDWIVQHFVIFIGLIWGGALVVSGRIVDFPRLYVYGGIVFGSLLAADLVPGYHMGTALLIAGGAILLPGILLLVRFIRKYPKHGAPTEDGFETE